ncbi:MAG TPA: TOBE domain-containing protein [Methylophilus sp.]
MNTLSGQVTHIESHGQLSLVDIAVSGGSLTATLLEAPGHAAYLQQGARVTVMFKATEVALAKHLSGQLSLRNRLPAIVTAIERGQLLTAVSLDYHGASLQSVITTRAVDALALHIGDAVEALIKANEVMLATAP